MHHATILDYGLRRSCDFVLSLGKKRYWGVMCSPPPMDQQAALDFGLRQALRDFSERWEETDGLRKPQVHGQRAGWCSRQSEHRRTAGSPSALPRLGFPLQRVC